MTKTVTKIAPLTIFALALNYLLWGSAMSVGKVALEGFSPLFMVGARLLIAALVFTPIIVIKYWPLQIRRKDILLLGLLILCDPIAFFMFEAMALKYTSASQASMMWAITPLLNTLAAVVILRERTTLSTILAFLVAMSGVIMLTATGEESTHASNPILGNFLEFLSLCGGAGFMVIVRFLGGRYPATLLVWIQCVGASLFFIPLILLQPDSVPTELVLEPTIALVYLGVCITFGAQFCVAYALARVPVTRISAISNLIPVIGVLFGILLLGESLLPIQWLACAIVLGAVIISQYFQNKAERGASEESEKKTSQVTAVNYD